MAEGTTFITIRRPIPISFHPLNGYSDTIITSNVSVDKVESAEFIRLMLYRETVKSRPRPWPWSAIKFLSLAQLDTVAQFFCIMFCFSMGYCLLEFAL